MPRIVLIAANDPNIFYLLQRYAEKTGFQTLEAKRGKDVVELAEQTTPAVIIIEDDFPGMLEGAVLQRLKEVELTREIPIIVYSCLDQTTSNPVQGVASFLLKSVRYDDFLAALKQAGVQL